MCKYIWQNHNSVNVDIFVHSAGRDARRKQHNDQITVKWDSSNDMLVVTTPCHVNGGGRLIKCGRGPGPDEDEL